MEFIYFFISYSRKERENREDIEFVVPDNDKETPECIISIENYENKAYNYKKIFRAINKSKTSKKKEIKYYFEFEIGDTKYIISFNAQKDVYFIYDITLQWGKADINIRRKINQNKVGYIEKLEIFKEALEAKNETEKIQELYKETIDLYSRKKGFYFLIELFLKIYKEKDLCSDLMKRFRKMNENPKENEKNMDRKQYLFKEEYIKKFSKVLSEANSIISDNKYKKVDFYGIILCYLNNYDYDKFTFVLNDFQKKNKKELFEILLTYNTHFKNQIKESFNFFDEFIKYTISKKDDNPDEDTSSKKDIIPIKSKKGTTSKKDAIPKKNSDFQIALSYIHDIETIIHIIDKNKEEIFEKYKGDPKNLIVLDKKIEFKEIAQKENIEESKSLDATKEGEITTTLSIQIKESPPEDKIVSDGKIHKKEKKNSKIDKIIKEIKDIISFCKKNDIFLVHFTNEFWKHILNMYNEPLLGNIKICSKLRNIFIEYYELVMKIFGKKKDKEKDSLIKKEAKNYYSTDEFAFLIDQIIKKVLKTADLKNIEKLSYITTYNPYYKEDQYSEKVDLDIFDLFKLNDIEEDYEFINDFRNMNFEIIFKQNISEYIDKIISKITKISNFDNIIKLINIKNIQDLGKIDKYLKSLNKKYDNIIRNEINFLSGKQLDKAIGVVADLVVINYKCVKKDEKEKKDKEEEKNKSKDKKQFEFIEKRIKKLDKKIIPLIFIEIMKICINYEDKKEKEEDNEKSGEKSLDEEDKENSKEQISDEDDNDIDFKELEKYIFKQFVNKLEKDEDITNIISLIECLEGKNTKVNENNEQNENNDKNENNGQNENKNKRLNEFLKELITKHLFKKDDFFSKKKNLKIDLLCKLNEKGIIKKNDEPYYDNIVNLVQEIRKDLEGEIQKKKLDEFLKNKEKIIKQRLDLIKFILENFEPEETYKELKKKIKKIN